uniref:CDK5 regulatory subunit associated protein 3 n=1 Tax=Sinocyclocheilus grahami TaxID=75366 RepID=A0A672KBX5_SINGR
GKTVLQHCTLKWQSAVMTIREKINAAIQDMPENEEIKQLLSGSYIHYFHCLRIIEILKGTEVSTKNIFGRYSSQRMKDWQEIVSLYEKDNVYLAEVASILIRSVSYEGPALRKQVSKAQQLQQELSRRELECQSGATDMRERYYAACKQYGIQGENVARELQALVKDLPVVLEETGKKAACLDEAIKFYAAFINFVSHWSEEALPILRFVQKKGNTTVYEWKTGNVPTIVERPVMEEAPPDVVTEETIDWGDLGDGADTEEVNFGISVEDGSTNQLQETSAGGIDWGASELTPVEIEIVDVASDVMLNFSKPVSMKKQTHLHLRWPEGKYIFSKFSFLINQCVCLCLSYVERVSELLRQKLKQADILVLKRGTLAEKRQEALEEQAKLEPRIDLLAARTKELQKLIEADISKRYNNRPVNLMGVHV